jgi:hypothetical protein
MLACSWRWLFWLLISIWGLGLGAWGSGFWGRGGVSAKSGIMKAILEKRLGKSSTTISNITRRLSSRTIGFKVVIFGSFCDNRLPLCRCCKAKNFPEVIILTPFKVALVGIEASWQGQLWNFREVKITPPRIIPPKATLGEALDQF